MALLADARKDFLDELVTLLLQITEGGRDKEPEFLLCHFLWGERISYNIRKVVADALLCLAVRTNVFRFKLAKHLAYALPMSLFPHAKTPSLARILLSLHGSG
jgi:hypothetical protein